MKIKILTIVCVLTFAFMIGCKGSSNTNANTTATNTSSPTPITKTTEAPTMDTAMKSKVEDALKKKGFDKITVDTTGGTAALRGTYPKGKLAEVMQTAQEASGKPVKNEATEEK
jgi:osmotically-inducible protein OsmY